MELSVVASRWQEAVGGVYEASAWVAAETACPASADLTLTAIAAALRATVDAATRERQLALLRAHPDLAGKAALASSLTHESTAEQARAGLGALTQDELDKFNALNGAYRDKFGFPFILAVRNVTKRAILAAFEARLSNTVAAEEAAALKQVHKIAWMRLLAAIAPAPTGKLTCHVLDTAQGCPAAGMHIELHRIGDAGERELIKSFQTNSDGRLPGGPALAGATLLAGVYEWTFCVGEYFVGRGFEPVCGLPFLDRVPVRFGIDNPEAHYHVPLLCSPWSFSTYRGS